MALPDVPCQRSCVPYNFCGYPPGFFGRTGPTGPSGDAFASDGFAAAAAVSSDLTPDVPTPLAFPASEPSSSYSGGVFTAPRSGLYAFAVTVSAVGATVVSLVSVWIQSLSTNLALASAAQTALAGETANVALSVVLRLEADDRVQLYAQADGGSVTLSALNATSAPPAPGSSWQAFRLSTPAA